MKLAAFLGSPRPNGNTDILAGKVLAGAKQANVNAESVALRALDIHPCTGCDECWKDDKPCVFSDDMTRLYDLIARSDVLLFATPVYWYGPTTLMKAFLDRFLIFNRPPGRPLIEGKAAILIGAYEEQGTHAAEPMLRMFELSFRYLGLHFLDHLLVDGVGPKGAVFDKPAALESAAAIGRGLGRTPYARQSEAP